MLIKPAWASSLQRVPKSGRAADPGNGLQVAQAAGTFLQIGFEVVIGIGNACMALLLLMLLGEKKFARIEVLIAASFSIPRTAWHRR